MTGQTLAVEVTGDQVWELVRQSETALDALELLETRSDQSLRLAAELRHALVPFLPRLHQPIVVIGPTVTRRQGG